MATFVYYCEPCDHEFETEHPIDAVKGANCDKCGKRTVNRLIAGSSFVLKGEGWAKDLYTKKEST